MKYLIVLELIMNDDKEKWVSDIPKIDPEFSFKTKQKNPLNK